MSDSDSNNIVKKKGRLRRKTWELHRVKNRGTVGQGDLTSALTAVMGWWITFLSRTCLLSSAVICTSSYLQWCTQGDMALSKGPCERGKEVFVIFQWRDAVVSVSSPWKKQSLLHLTHSVNRMFEYSSCIDQCACVHVVSDSVEKLFWTTDAVCVIENPFHTVDWAVEVWMDGRSDGFSISHTKRLRTRERQKPL